MMKYFSLIPLLFSMIFQAHPALGSDQLVVVVNAQNPVNKLSTGLCINKVTIH